MMRLVGLVLFLFSAQGFQPFLASSRRALVSLRQTYYEEARSDSHLSDGEIIRRLHQHYRELQDELFQDLQQDDKLGALQASKELFMTAADLNQVERYEQYLKVQDSQKHLKQTQEDLHEAEEWVQNAHKKAVQVDEQSHTVQSMDEIFDLDKRAHDTKISQNALHCEEFANNLLQDAQFEELQAELEYEHAEELLRDLQANQEMLQRSLEQMRDEDSLLEHWYQVELPKHQNFLQTAVKAIRSGKLSY